MTTPRISLPTFAALLVCALGAGTVDALNIETHRTVNVIAANTAAFDGYLRDHSGFVLGRNEPFQGQTVLSWIEEGGEREDDGLGIGTRVVNHWHDPLRAWAEAGLKAAGNSSVIWMQRRENFWSWAQARGFFYDALTAPRAAPRRAAWADTFRAIGQMMHLVVDASVPEHVRDDIHPKELICRTFGTSCLGNYEYWVSDEQARNPLFNAQYLSSPIGFDRSILGRPTNDVRAPVPVARIIDSDLYTGADPNVTWSPTGALVPIGIAEFTSANFFSQDTIDNSRPFPSVARLEPSRLPAPKTGRTRAYFKKGAGDGHPVDPVAAECITYELASLEGVLEEVSRKCQDQNVWKAAAGILLPRAVGYARGTLDYFFRGRIEIAPPARFPYAIAQFLPGNTGAFTTLRFKVRNATPGETMTCPAGQTCDPPKLTAIVHYRLPLSGSLIDNPLGPLGESQFAISVTQPVPLVANFAELAFDFRASPIPTNAADLFLTVVYRGPLGLEKDAVVVGGKRLFAPDPIDRANVSDYDCFANTIWGLIDPATGQPLPAFQRGVDERRDVTGDHVADLLGPFRERGVLLKTFHPASPQTASEGNFDQAVDIFDFGRFSRFMILQDQDFYGLAAHRRGVDEFSTGLSVSPPDESTFVGGIVNGLFELLPGRVFHVATLSGVMRGLSTYRIFLVMNNPTLACRQQINTAQPPVSQALDFVPTN